MVQKKERDNLARSDYLNWSTPLGKNTVLLKRIDHNSGAPTHNMGRNNSDALTDDVH